MDFKYMTKMQLTPWIGDYQNEPIAESQVLEIEMEIGKTFPLAYREFLLLGGNDTNMMADMDTACFIDDEKYWKERQAMCRENMKGEGMLPTKDFWVFADLGPDQFHFFYFDDSDDPTVYHYCSFMDGDSPAIRDLNRTFTEHVNKLIRHTKRVGY